MTYAYQFHMANGSIFKATTVCYDVEQGLDITCTVDEKEGIGSFAKEVDVLLEYDRVIISFDDPVSGRRSSMYLRTKNVVSVEIVRIDKQGSIVEYLGFYNK